MIKTRPTLIVLTWAFMERVTRIELALSAWEAERLRLPGVLTWRSWRPRVTVADPSSPWLMAR
jgi:hypothetical protein